MRDDARPARGRRWRRFAVSGLVLLVVVWLVYKATTIRRTNGRSIVDSSCESDINTAADVNGRESGPASVRCQTWDIGTGVTGYVWRAPDPSAVVLLEHGWGDYAQRCVKQCNELIPRFLERGISVHAVDMWGHGRSRGKRGAADLGEAVEDHLAARRKLRDQSLPLFVLGHSVGGLVTATSVLRDGNGVRGMILIAPALKWQMSDSMRFVARTGAFLLPTLRVPGPAPGPEEQSLDSQFTDRLTRDPLMNLGNITWLSASTGATMSHANWKEYPHITVPVLVVNGTADRVTTAAASRQFIDAIGSQDKTLRLIDSGRHSLLDDPPGNAEALAEILDWVERRVRKNDAAKAEIGLRPSG